MTAGDLLDALSRAASAGETIRVDLSEVSFMDSTGVRAFIQASRWLDRDAALVLIAPSPQLGRLFDLTGLDRVPGITILSDPPGHEGPG